MMVNKRTKYRDDTKKNKKPTKKYMSLIGKTAYDIFTSNVGKSVWNKKFVKNSDGIKICSYIRSKCYDPNCTGYLIYDKRGFQHCNICGLGTGEHEISLLPKLNYNKNDDTVSYVLEESINDRNKSHDLMYLKYVDYSDPNYRELKERHDRITEFEKVLANGKRQPSASNI
jgi:hypothetical protein